MYHLKVQKWWPFKISYKNRFTKYVVQKVGMYSESMDTNFDTNFDQNR